MIGSSTNSVKWQATVVQIQENIHSYLSGNWIPSFSVLDHVNIDPQKMVENYPSSWKNTEPSTSGETGLNQTTKTTSNNGPSFFSKIDHPSWYINGANEKVGDAATANKSSLNSQSNAIIGSKGIVLPWKQYITNLGNMYAKNGELFIFGGNGSMYNDPEALSIGIFRINFRSFGNSQLVENEVVGIPYAYLLSNLQYNPEDSSSTIQLTNNWNKCYAPIKQDTNFNYVPRLAIAGVQTNVTGTLPFLYLSGAITVGQVANSQNRAWKPENQSVIAGATIGNLTANPVAKNLQNQRSLQLTGANVLSTISSEKENLAAERNSIDPCLLFGTAFNVDQLGNINVSSSSNVNDFENVLMDNNYFEIGSTIGNTSSSVTYYFYDQNNLKCQAQGQIENHLTWSNQKVNENTNRLAFDNKEKKFLTPTKNPIMSLIEPVYEIPTSISNSSNTEYNEFNFFENGDAKLVYEYNSLNKYTIGEVTQTNSRIVVSGASMASYSWNLPLLVDNARNYYYPTLCYGYSLKSVGSLTKISKGSQSGYAMQVGKSILFINEPKFVKNSSKTSIDNIQNLIYRGPSTVSIGDETTFGEAKFGGGSSGLNTDNSNKYDYKYGQITDGTVDPNLELINILKKTPFSFSGNTKVDESIIKSGTTQLVAGIKDLNTTVSSIAATFKISADPYAITDQTSSLAAPTLSWNQFMGLTSSSDGTNLVSSWKDLLTNESKRFALTSELLFSDFSSLKSNTDLTFQDGVKQGWFEKKETISNIKGNDPINVENANMPTNASSIDTYFKKTTSINPKIVFKSNIINSGNSVIYAQQALEGIAYVIANENTYKTETNVNSDQIFGNIDFKSEVIYKDLGISSYKQLFDISFNDNVGYIENNTEYTCLVKQQFVDKLLSTPSAPTYSSSISQIDKPNGDAWYKLVAFISNNKPEINFVIYAWNPLTHSYEMAPNITNNNGFIIDSNKLANVIGPISPESHKNEINWIIPIAVGIPILMILFALMIFFIVKSKKNKNYIAKLSSNNSSRSPKIQKNPIPNKFSQSDKVLIIKNKSRLLTSSNKNKNINNTNQEIKKLPSSMSSSSNKPKKIN